MSFVKLTWVDRAEVVEIGAGGSVKIEVPAVSGLQSWQLAGNGLLSVAVCDDPEALAAEPEAVTIYSQLANLNEEAAAKKPAPKKPAAKKKAPAKKPAAKPKRKP